MDTKKTTHWLKTLGESHKEKIKYLSQFVFVVAVYGLILSFISQHLLSYPMTIPRILALGFSAYLIKAELPQIISSCFPRAPPQFKV